MVVYIYIYIYEYWLAEFDENSTSRYIIIGRVVVVDDVISKNTISGPMASTYSFVYVTKLMICMLASHATGCYPCTYIEQVTYAWVSEAMHFNIVLCALI
jgi:hypothetical protein